VRSSSSGGLDFGTDPGAVEFSPGRAVGTDRYRRCLAASLGPTWLRRTGEHSERGGLVAEDVHAHIEELVAEEHRLWELESSGQAGDDERRRLAELKVELDRYWDLLRRRRAAKAAGADPDGEDLRSETTVESYLQ
jgi:Protein of unknown function (DUF2630)